MTFDLLLGRESQPRHSIIQKSSGGNRRHTSELFLLLLQSSFARPVHFTFFVSHLRPHSHQVPLDFHQPKSLLPMSGPFPPTWSLHFPMAIRGQALWPCTPPVPHLHGQAPHSPAPHNHLLSQLDPDLVNTLTAGGIGTDGRLLTSQTPSSSTSTSSYLIPVAIHLLVPLLHPRNTAFFYPCNPDDDAGFLSILVALYSQPLDLMLNTAQKMYFVPRNFSRSSLPLYHDFSSWALDPVTSQISSPSSKKHQALPTAHRSSR